ncbi:unnamed protein product [Moneuplotes crassus]|uniref:Uncharacterized protein n=1 Tax=Euplotes crassus TaxID=5936 RepID=A0AAD1X9A9_EUPCR|nr:unnamed protein product [Moneuplotes crassus]
MTSTEFASKDNTPSRLKKFITSKSSRKDYNFVSEEKKNRNEVQKDIEKLLKQEFYQKASENVKNAIRLRTKKDTKSFFYRQLQNLNDKIVVFKSMQEKFCSNERFNEAYPNVNQLLESQGLMDKHNNINQLLDKKNGTQKKRQKSGRLNLEIKSAKHKNSKKKLDRRRGSKRSSKFLSTSVISSCDLDKNKYPHENLEIDNPISENEEDYSQISKPKEKQKKRKSNRKNRFKLPDLKLKLHEGIEKKCCFKKHARDVGRIVSVIDSISSVSKKKIDMNKSFFIKSKEKKLSSKRIQETSFRSNKFINSDKNDQTFQTGRVKSTSPAWNRLSAPRYISPNLSAIKPLQEHILNGELPNINKKKKEMSNTKLNNSRTQLVYQNSVKSLRSIKSNSKPRVKLPKKILKSSHNFEVSSQSASFNIENRFKMKHKGNRNFNGSMNRTLILNKKPEIENIRKIYCQEIS